MRQVTDHVERGEMHNGSNRPDLQVQVDDLERKVELLREAIFSLVSAHLPAMQAIDHLAEAAAKLNSVDSDA